jgi:hypothetical protein
MPGGYKKMMHIIASVTVIAELQTASRCTQLLPDAEIGVADIAEVGVAKLGTIVVDGAVGPSVLALETDFNSVVPLPIV